ncbi:MalM family protein [Vibrio maritimus]|uniref:MalM family protein n=1 Tax=Vibrio maritimus TaxID=990268 RepID=UPI00406758B1
MKRVFLAAVVASLIGCTSSQVQTSESSPLDITELSSQKDCCTTLSKVSYEPITKAGDLTAVIDTNSQKVGLVSGVSYVKGYELPVFDGEANLEVISLVGNQVFVPSILILDNEYKALDVLSSSDLSYRNSGIMYSTHYAMEKTISQKYPNGKSPRYLVIFTTDKDLKDSTLIKPSSDSAIRSGSVEANLAANTEWNIPHAAVGTVELELDYSGPAVRQESKQQQQDREAALAAVVVTDQQSVMDTEFVELFDDRIRAAVRAGEFDRALDIMKQAEKQGSPTARETFVEAMKKFEG